MSEYLTIPPGDGGYIQCRSLKGNVALNAHFRQCDVTVAHTSLFLVILLCIVHARIRRTTVLVLFRKCVNRLT